jgi:hypothetical protein
MEKEIGKYKIEVVQDEYPDSPDSWGNEDAFVVYDHRQFYVERKGFKPRDIWEHSQKSDKLYNGYYFFVLYAYIHSGVSLSVGDHNFPDARWDVSSTGYVLVKREKYTYTREAAFKMAESITKEWNEYLWGEVWGFKITDAEDDEVVDSCWGFYGDEENCMTEAENVVNSLIENDKKNFVGVNI